MLFSRKVPHVILNQKKIIIIKCSPLQYFLFYVSWCQNLLLGGNFLPSWSSDSVSQINNVDHVTTEPQVKYVGGKLAGGNWTWTLSCSFAQAILLFYVCQAKSWMLQRRIQTVQALFGKRMGKCWVNAKFFLPLFNHSCKKASWVCWAKTKFFLTKLKNPARQRHNQSMKHIIWR